MLSKLIISAALILTTASCAIDEDIGTEEQEGTIALFEGVPIDLKEDWGDAKSCVIWQSMGVVECFRHNEDTEELIASLTADDLEPPSTKACPRNCLHIYDHSSFGGRDLRFCDRGYWQNLSNWGFNDQTSSYKTGVHSVHLSEHAGGNGWWYPGNTGACVSSGGMSNGWNDRISAIFIN